MTRRHRQVLLLAGLVLALGAWGVGARRRPAEFPFANATACYQRAMGLTDWTLTVVVYRDTADRRYAFTGWNPVRREAVSSYNAALANAANGRAVVVHELTHLLTAELYFLAASTSVPAAQLAGERVSDAVGRWEIWRTVCPEAGP